MDHSGVTGYSCEKDNLVTVENSNREINSSTNVEGSAEPTTSVSQISSHPLVGDSSTTLVTTSSNTQPSSVSAVIATGLDMSISASDVDGKNSVTSTAINTVANSMLPQDSSSMAISDVKPNSAAVSSSISSGNVLTSGASMSAVTVPSSDAALTRGDSSVIKTEQKNLSYIPYQAPVLPATTEPKMSTYDSSKVAAEMAEIDSFLKSLASGNSGSSSNYSTTKTVPLASSSKTAVNDIVVMPTGRSALGKIAQSYGDSDESSSSSSDESEDEELVAAVGSNKMATAAVAMDTSEMEQSIKKVAVSSSSDDSSSSSSGSDDDMGDGDETKKKQQQVVPRTRNENLPQDLPPVLPVDVTLPEDAQLEVIGWVHSIVKQIVVVAHNSKLRVVNVDTVFWLEDHTPLGKVFEVFGPVAHPYYSIRVRGSDGQELLYAVGSKVFFVSNDSNLTYYVFADQIEKQKGSDASWLNDEEPPTQFLDYSDDEDEEAIAKKEGRKQRIPPATSHQGPRKKKHSHKSSHRADSQATAAVSSQSYTSDPHLQKYFPSAIDQQGRTQLTTQAIPQPPYYLPPPQQLGNTPSSSFSSNPPGVYHSGQVSQGPPLLYYPPYPPPPIRPCTVPPPPQAMPCPPGIPFQPVSHHYPLAASRGLLHPPQSGTQSVHPMLSTISELNPNTNSFV